MFIQPVINAQSHAGLPFLILPMYAPLLLTISKGVTNVLQFILFFSNVLDIARKYKPTAQYVTKYTSKKRYLCVTLWQNLTYFFHTE